MAAGTAVELVAARLVTAVAEMTGGRPGQWHMVHDVAAHW